MNCVIKAIKAGIIIFSIAKCGKEIPVGMIREIDCSLEQMQMVRDVLVGNPELDPLLMRHLQEMILHLSEIAKGASEIAKGATGVFAPPGLPPVVSFSSAPRTLALTAPVSTAEFGQEQQQASDPMSKVTILAHVPHPKHPPIIAATFVTRHPLLNPPPAATMSSCGSASSLSSPPQQATPVYPLNFFGGGSLSSTPPYPIQPPIPGHHFVQSPIPVQPDSDLRREQTIHGIHFARPGNMPPEVRSAGLTPPIGLGFTLQGGARLGAPPPTTRYRL